MCPSTSNTPDTLRFEVNDEIPVAFTVVTETPLVPTVKPPVKEVAPVTSRSSATLTLPLPSPDNVRFVSVDLEIIAFGTHLDENYGKTINEIYSSGFKVKHQIETSEAGTATAILLGTACRLIGLH